MGGLHRSTAAWGVFFLLAAVAFRLLRAVQSPRTDGYMASQTLTVLLGLLGAGLVVSAIAARVGREKT